MKLNKKLVISILCILAILGYIIGQGVVPYKLTTLCPSVCFLGIGYISSTLYLQIIKNNSLIKIFIFTIITFFISVINIPRLDLAWNQIGNPILGYIGGICGTLLVLTFSKNIITLNKTIKKILLYIGSNTLIILAFHQLILASLKELSVHYIILQHSLVRFICCIIILYFIIYICNNYFYFILGKNEVLQINVVANSGSTGKISEKIGSLAIDKGWVSYIAYGRWYNPSRSTLIKIGNKFDIIMPWI